MKKRMHKNLLRRIVLVAASVILGLSVYFWNAQNLLGNRMPMPFGYGVATVLSGSMEPTLRVDDLVIIRQTDTVQVGDIIVYQDADALIIHRVQEISGDCLVTKGDANTVADEAISLADVKGVMAASIPGAGAVVRFVRKPAVTAMVLIAAVVLTELSYQKDKKKNKQELDALEDEIRRLMAEMKDES